MHRPPPPVDPAVKIGTVLGFVIVAGFALLWWWADASANSYNAHLVRVYDGDTIIARVNVWPRITAEVSIRLRGVQAPEIGWRANSECEREAASQARQFVVENLLGDFQIEDVREGTYPGRVIADIIIDGVSLSEMLLTRGHAIPYDGRGRAPMWEC